MRDDYYFLVGQRLKIIRELLLLKIEEVKILTGIPATTLRRIESGARTTINKNIDLLSNLYKVSKTKILDIKQPIPSWQTLSRTIHKESKDNDYLLECIKKRPAQRKAVQFRVMQSTFLNNFRKTEEIRLHIQQRYNWTYSFEDIIMALDSLADEDLLEIEENKSSAKRFRKSRKKTKHILSVPSIIIIKLEELYTSYQDDSVTPIYDRMAAMLLIIKNGEIPRSELYKLINYSNAHNNHLKTLKILENLKLVEQTEDKPNSKNQKYRLTEKGRIFLKELGIE